MEKLIPHIQKAHQMRKDEKSIEEISSFFKSENLSEEEVTYIIADLKKAYYAKLRAKGFVYIGIGVFFLLFCFMILLFMSFDHPYFQYVLYGVTTLGASMVLYGLANVLGW